MTLSVDDSPSVNTSLVWRSNPRLFQADPSRSSLQAELTVFFPINVGSVSDPMIIWNAHKAFMRGVLIKRGARAKRQRRQHIQDLISKIHILEAQNKRDASPKVSDSLTQLRHDLCLMTLRKLPSVLK